MGEKEQRHETWFKKRNFQLTVLGRGGSHQFDGSPGRIAAADNSDDLDPNGLNLQRGGDTGEDGVVEGFHRVVVAADVEVLAYDRRVKAVREIGVEEIWGAAAGEDFFNLVCIRIWCRHDGGQ